MRIFTKRNALVGWLVLGYARRKARRRLRRAGNARRRGLLVGAGIVGAATALAVLVRRGNGLRADATG